MFDLSGFWFFHHFSLLPLLQFARCCRVERGVPRSIAVLFGSRADNRIAIPRVLSSCCCASASCRFQCIFFVLSSPFAHQGRVELPASVHAAGVQGIRFLQQRDSRKMFRGSMPKKVRLTVRQGSVEVEGKQSGSGPRGCIGWSHQPSSSSSDAIMEADGLFMRLGGVVEMHEEKRSGKW